MEVSPFRAAHVVVAARRKAGLLSGRMTIKENRNKGVRRIPVAGLKKAPKPMSSFPARTIGTIVARSPSNSRIRSSGRCPRNSLIVQPRYPDVWPAGGLSVRNRYVAAVQFGLRGSAGDRGTAAEA